MAIGYRTDRKETAHSGYPGQRRAHFPIGALTPITIPLTMLSLRLLSLLALVPAVSATDYLGGWLPAASNASSHAAAACNDNTGFSSTKQQCVDICVGAKTTPTCLTSAPECVAKKMVPGDYDYLLLEQLFVPQFCRDLLLGVDSTISHQNVNVYPNGTACQPQVAQSTLTIHGLWPNYNDGYVSCCNATESAGNHPYNALDFALNHDDLLQEMSTKWIDATQVSAYDTLCEIYDHEFQKHGLCFGAFGDDFDYAAANYFRATMNAADQNAAATAQINAWAAATPPQIPSLADIEALYPKHVQVLCSAVDGINQFSVVRTCYEKTDVIGSTGPFTPRDCDNATSTTTFVPCNASVPITLLPYTAPQ